MPLQAYVNHCWVTWTSICYVLISATWIACPKKTCDNVTLLNVNKTVSTSLHVMRRSRSSRTQANVKGRQRNIDLCLCCVFQRHALVMSVIWVPGKPQSRSQGKTLFACNPRWWARESLLPNDTHLHTASTHRPDIMPRRAVAMGWCCRYWASRSPAPAGRLTLALKHHVARICCAERNPIYWRVMWFSKPVKHRVQLLQLSACFL